MEKKEEISQKIIKKEKKKKLHNRGKKTNTFLIRPNTRYKTVPNQSKQIDYYYNR